METDKTFSMQLDKGTYKKGEDYEGRGHLHSELQERFYGGREA
jgi:hypothetical protein